MGDLSELTLQTSYHKGRDNLADDFYLPCMRRSIEYDRAVGFFRSSIFIIAWSALRDFVQRGGRFRVLCSHVMSQEDVEALSTGYSARADRALAAHFCEEVRILLQEESLREPARVLAALVARGSMEFQVAVLAGSEPRGASRRIFHDKLGIFRDGLGNAVTFKGSMNETWSGLAADGNLESIDVAATWMGSRDAERARNEQAYFEDLWSNRYPTLYVRPFPKVAREELADAANPDWESALEGMVHGRNNGRARADKQGRVLRSHQAEGLASWRANNRRGILAFATGSGKTFTALTAIKEAIQTQQEVAVVVVPDRVLFSQWHQELREAAREVDAQILRAGAGQTRWRDSLHLWTRPEGRQPRIVLATARTASSEDFVSRLAAGDHLLLVADEVHRLGSPRNRVLLSEELFGPRLGLSATPERAGDAEGTAALLSFFNGVLEPRYTLADAVRDGVLCHYFYRPHTLELTDSEAASWKALTAELAQLRGRIQGGDDSVGIEEKLKRLYIRRARIVKHAAAKVGLSVRVLTSEYQRGQRWIVYCEDTQQLEEVCSALSTAGIENLPFHSQMEGDRQETLKWLDVRGGVVVAIRCLDEGVDVPSVTHALILASSKNPREFTQRRGRVLRTAPGKALAYVHDAIVVPGAPDLDSDGNRVPDPIAEGELARALQFAEHADNPACGSDLRQIAIDSGIDWQRMARSGVEDADD